MSKRAYLGFDLGAESGRAVLGIRENDRLRREEVKRYEREVLSRRA